MAKIPDSSRLLSKDWTHSSDSSMPSPAHSCPLVRVPTLDTRKIAPSVESLPHEHEGPGLGPPSPHNKLDAAQPCNPNTGGVDRKTPGACWPARLPSHRTPGSVRNPVSQKLEWTAVKESTPYQPLSPHVCTHMHMHTHMNTYTTYTHVFLTPL